MSAIKCTALHGRHVVPAAALRCPVHGPMMVRAAGLPDATLNTEPPGMRVDARTGMVMRLRPDDLISMAASVDPKRREEAAAHPDATAEMLTDLACDTNGNVRAAVASRSGLIDPDIITGFASEQDDYVRRAALANPDCDPEVLRAAVESYDGNRDGDALAAMTNPSCPQDCLLSTLPTPIGLRVFRNPALTEDFLREAAQRLDARDLGSLLAHVNCPEDLVRSLLPSAPALARAQFALDPDAPSDMLETLSRDMGQIPRVHANRPTPNGQAFYGWLVRDSAAENPATPPRALADIVDEGVRLFDRNSAATMNKTYSATARAVRNPSTPGLQVQKVIDAGEEHPAHQDAVEGRRQRIAAATGISGANTQALDLLGDTDMWWGLTPESPQTSLATAMHPDA